MGSDFLKLNTSQISEIFHLKNQRKNSINIIRIAINYFKIKRACYNLIKY